MFKPRLLLDEDVRSLLADVLRQRGYDAVAAVEVGLAETEDDDVLDWAVGHERAVVSHNTKDFVRLAEQYAEKGWEHFGIIVSDRAPFRVILARLMRLLTQKEGEDLVNRLEWLQNYG